MSIDNIRDSECKVVSKYFAGKTVMDESLTDFQEKKKSCAGPKNSKPTATKTRAKKTKKLKGQKDIRTALKPKKNELIAYAKDFDDICKKSGIDVDSEQLQLAIALSKSLQQTEDSRNTSQTESLTTQQRTGLIRTTLKEYGFKVPDTKKGASTSRKLKKYRKPYKLLQSTPEEKQQIVSDKYSQVLFKNFNPSKTEQNTEIDFQSIHLFHIATNMAYEDIRNESVFYVENLIEKTPNSMGCLLKNWSDIPGRPLSPKQDKSELVFSEIECSQEELDTVLSGTLKYSKDFLKNRHKTNEKKSKNSENLNDSICIESDAIEKNTNCVEEHNLTSVKNIEVKTTDVDQYLSLSASATLQASRSLSPDLFDDDETVIENNSVITIDSPEKPKSCPTYGNSMALVNCDLLENNLTDPEKSNISKRISTNKSFLNDNEIEVDKGTSFKDFTTSIGIEATSQGSSNFMDLTECVKVNSQNKINASNIDPYEISKTKLGTEDVALSNSQKTSKHTYPYKPGLNSTLKVDAVMDLTECVKTKQFTFINNSVRHQRMSLSQSNLDTNITKRKSNDFMEITECVASLSQPVLQKIDDHIDLTGTCDGNEIVYKKPSLDNIESMDLTQSSNSDDDALPFVQITGKITKNKSLEEEKIKAFDITNEDNKVTVKDKLSEEAGNKSFDITVNDKSSDDTVLLNIDEYQGICNSPKIISIEDEIETSKNIKETDNEDIDTDCPLIFKQKEVQSEPNKSELGILDDSKSNDVVTEVNDNIDLTQNSESSDENNDESTNQYTNSSLGKQDNVSVDYDEVLEHINSYPLVTNESYNINEDFANINNYDEERAKSGDFEVLELSDDEPNNAPENSKVTDNHFDLGGMSVIDNLKSFNTNSRLTGSTVGNRSLSDSLPIVNVKENESKKAKDKTLFKDKELAKNDKEKSPVLTPLKGKNNEVRIETPTRNEYIVKTHNVTPIVDYASMTTPERNKELDKYGLKPFKRKRAIQLLTHLYNQTHPFVESTEEVTSPSKRRKKDASCQPSKTKSPRKPKSPRNCLLRENFEAEMESGKENVYKVTSEVPDIKNIECGTEDWVFQKREKAKLHSCRVPLHIAFHNYVSCRRGLHEAILRYEPINIDIVHKELAASGHKYDPKDLLKFLDKKCITVKTADNAKSNRRY